jgi:hypothetical protein
MNFPSDLIGSIVANAMAAIEDIKRDPVAFILNMIAALKRGFGNFFTNILTHLTAGLSDWLFRGLRQAGLQPPRDLTLGSVLDFVMQVLGITVERLWQKLGERIGPERVALIRGALDRLTGIIAFIRDVQQRGVAAIWEYVESQISGLWDMVLQKAKDWIMERIINRAIQWLLSLLDVTGIMPVINSAMAFFRAVQSAIDYLRDILMIVNDYVTTIAAVARGQLEPGAQKVETGLARAVPVAIGFLANQFGLGNIGERITEIVGEIRGVVDRALDWLIDRAVSGVQALLRTLGIGGGAAAAEGRLEKDFTATGGAAHELTVDLTGSQPDIKVASGTPTGVQHQIQDRRNAAAPTADPRRDLSPEQTAALALAWEEHGQLVALSRRYIAANEEGKAALRTEIVRLMDSLAGHMVAGDAWPSTDIPPTQVSTAPGHVVANPLTRRPGNTVGSAAADVIPGWQANVGPQTAGRGGSLTWRRVHLLSDRLHGPGTDPNNLIPADETTNGDLRRGPEAAAYAAIMRGETLEYTASVTPDANHPFFPSALTVTVKKIAPAPEAPVWSGPIRIARPPTTAGPQFTTAQLSVINAYKNLRAAGTQPSQILVARSLGQRSQSAVSERIAEIRAMITAAPRPLHPDLADAATALGIPY